MACFQEYLLGHSPAVQVTLSQAWLWLLSAPPAPLVAAQTHHMLLAVMHGKLSCLALPMQETGGVGFLTKAVGLSTRRYQQVCLLECKGIRQ